MLRDGDVRIPVRISRDSKIVDGDVKGGLGVGFPVFPPRAVSKSCTVRDSDRVLQGDHQDNHIEI